jgi:hypothetical protein
VAGGNAGHSCLTLFLICRILIVPALAGLVLGGSSEQSIQAEVEVQGALASPYRIDDPDVAGFRFKYGVRVTNRSGRSLNLPKSGAVDDGLERVTIISVEAKRPDGQWSDIIQGMYVAAVTTKYASCKALPSGSQAKIANLRDGFVLLKSQVAKLGNQPTLRFSLMMICRQADGKLAGTQVTTDGLSLRLNAQP